MGVKRVGGNEIGNLGQRGGSADFFKQAFVVQVRTETNILDADGEALEIIPGMVAEIDILAGRKTILEYLTRPVIRVKERALRE